MLALCVGLPDYFMLAENTLCLIRLYASREYLDKAFMLAESFARSKGFMLPAICC